MTHTYTISFPSSDIISFEFGRIEEMRNKMRLYSTAVGLSELVLRNLRIINAKMSKLCLIFVDYIPYGYYVLMMILFAFCVYINMNI